MDNPEFYSNFLGSSTANVALVFLFGMALWIRRRLKVTRCASHCGFFDCEAQLQELKHVKEQVNTQRGMLENMLEMLDGNSQAVKTSSSNNVTAEEPFVLETPKRTNI